MSSALGELFVSNFKEDVYSKELGKVEKDTKGMNAFGLTLQQGTTKVGFLVLEKRQRGEDAIR